MSLGIRPGPTHTRCTRNKTPTVTVVVSTFNVQRSTFKTTQHPVLIVLLVLNYDPEANVLDVRSLDWCCLENSKVQLVSCLPISILFQLDHIIALTGKVIQPHTVDAKITALRDRNCI